MLHDVLHDFLIKLCCRFLQVNRVKEVGVKGIQHTDKLAKRADEQLDIGFTTKQLLKKLIEDGLDNHQVKKFYSGVRKFYVTALNYGRSHLPLDDPLLKNARFLNFRKKESATMSQVEYFVNRYSVLLPFNEPAQIETLKEEFISYQLLDEDDVPMEVWDKATVRVDEDSRATLHSTDVIWAYLSSRKRADGNPEFLLLSQVAQLILTIPHSNAAEERGFSTVRKNKTPFWPNLDPDETLGSIITTKMALPDRIPPYKFEPPKELIDAAKKATREYNQAHKKSDNTLLLLIHCTYTTNTTVHVYIIICFCC